MCLKHISANFTLPLLQLSRTTQFAGGMSFPSLLFRQNTPALLQSFSSNEKFKVFLTFKDEMQENNMVFIEWLTSPNRKIAQWDSGIAGKSLLHQIPKCPRMKIKIHTIKVLKAFCETNNAN